MITDAKTGLHGCDWCHKPVMTKIESAAGLVELCWDCTLRCLGRTSLWLEERHRSFADHFLHFMRNPSRKAKDREALRKWLE